MKVYISNYLSRSISILNYNSFEIEKEIELGEDVYPQHFCVDKNKNLMYIPGASDGIIYVLDLKEEKIIDNISIGGNLTKIILVDKELFVLNEDSNSIYILDKDTINPIGIISVDDMPRGFEFDKRNNELYLSGINSIMAIDILNKRIDKKVDTEFKIWNLSVDTEKKEIYTLTLEGKVIVIDGETMNVMNVLEAFLLPVEICFNYKENKVYVVDIGYGDVRILDYITGKYIRSIEVDGDPQGLQISNDEKLLFVSDSKRNSIKIYDTLDYSLLKEVKVGKQPTAIVCV